MDEYDMDILASSIGQPTPPLQHPPIIPDQPSQIQPFLILTAMVMVVSTIGLAVHVKVSAKKALLFILTLSVISTWANLYYIAAAKKKAKLFKLSSQCFGGEKGWTRATMDSLAGIFFKSSDPCEEYFIAVMVDPFWEVSLLEAVTSLMVKSTGAVGDMAGAFFTSIVHPLPIFWRIPVFVTVLLILVYLVRDMLRVKLQLYHSSLSEPENPSSDHQPNREMIGQEIVPPETLTNALTMTSQLPEDLLPLEPSQNTSAKEGKKPFGHSIKKLFKEKVLKGRKSQK